MINNLTDYLIALYVLLGGMHFALPSSFDVSSSYVVNVLSLRDIKSIHENILSNLIADPLHLLCIKRMCYSSNWSLWISSFLWII